MALKSVKEKIRVVFLGTPEFACPTLKTLLTMYDCVEIEAVVTQPDRPAGRNMPLQKSSIKVLCEEHQAVGGKMGRKFPVFTPVDVNEPKFLETLNKIKPDIAIVVAYGQILSADFLNIFKHGAVNIHASLLPRWRGAAPIAWALLERDSETGVTLQKVAQKLDSGDIIATSKLKLDDKWEASTLYSELSKRGADLVFKHLENYVRGRSDLISQDDKLVTWAPKIKKEQGLIDWQKSAGDICAQIRALSPWPGTWTTREGKVLKILRADPADHIGGQPGELVGVDKINFWVQCGMGTALKVSVVQPESRSRQSAAEYMRGYPFEKGDKLG